MKATHALIQSDRFPCVWSEEPDCDPPPGHDFAQALLEEFIRNGASTRSPKVEDNHWDQWSWYFWVDWNDQKYRIHVEPSLDETTPPTWHVEIIRLRGIWQSLFGSREGMFDVPDELLRIAAAALQRTTGCGAIAWITEDEAIDKLWGSQSARGAGTPKKD